VGGVDWVTGGAHVNWREIGDYESHCPVPVVALQLALTGPTSEMCSPVLVSNSMFTDPSPPVSVSLFTVIVPEVTCNEGGFEEV
jgi:hypothetical protein